eukprot:1160911-Pelagomonas_calceolata.AAC.7
MVNNELGDQFTLLTAAQSYNQCSLCLCWLGQQPRCRAAPDHTLSIHHNPAAPLTNVVCLCCLEQHPCCPAALGHMLKAHHSKATPLTHAVCSQTLCAHAALSSIHAA